MLHLKRLPARASNLGTAACMQDVKLAQECVDANLSGFPAWIINGKKLDGEQSFDKLDAELAAASRAHAGTAASAVALPTP